MENGKWNKAQIVRSLHGANCNHFCVKKEAGESRFWLRVISAACPGLTPRLIAQLQESNS